MPTTRSNTGIGAVSTDDFSRQAEVKAKNWRATARALYRDMQLNPPKYGPGERAYVTPEEATIDLGLSNIHQRAAVAGIKQIVKDTRSMMSIAKEWRELGMSQPVLRELLKRAKNLTAELRTRRSWVAKSDPPAGGGWESIPGGKSGGFRRRKSGGGFEYSYPDGKGGSTTHDSPAADEHGDVHDDHAYATPDEKVAAKHTELRAKAREAGVTLSGSLNSTSSLKHMEKLEKLLDQAIAAKKKSDAKGPQGPDVSDDEVDAGGPSDDAQGPEGGDDAPKGDTEPQDAADGSEKGGDDTQVTDDELNALASSKGVSSKVVAEALAQAEFKTAEGRAALKAHLEGMPDIDKVPNEPLEGDDKKALLDHIAKLEGVLDDMEKRLGEKGDKEAIKGARAEAKAVRGRPSPRGGMSLATRVWGLAILGLGFTAGLMLAGPVMGLMAMTVADKWMQQYGVPGSEEAEEAAAKVKAKAVGDNPKKPTGDSGEDGSAKADKGDKDEDDEPTPEEKKSEVKKGFLLVSVGGCLLRKSAVDRLLKAERPSGGGWTAVPGGKRGGYRKPKSAGGFEYWYPGGRAAGKHVEHHAEQREENKRRLASFESRGRAPQSVLDSVRRQIDMHDEAHAAATEAAGREEKYGTRHGQAHAGKRTLGVDEGVVHSAVADLMGNLVSERELGEHKQAQYGTAFFRRGTTVGVKTVTGHTVNIPVRMEASGNPGFAGALHSKNQPTYDAQTDTFDHDKLQSTPSRIVISVPREFEGSKAEFAVEIRRVLAHELAHALDELTGSHKKRDRSAYESGGEHYYNDPAEIVAFRHNIFRELNDLAVRDDVIASTTELRPRRKRGQPAPENQTAHQLHLDGKTAMELVRVHSPTWGRVVPHLNEANKKKLLESATAVLQAHHAGSSQPVKKSRSRSVNEYGHRYDLTPAHTLTPRQGWARDLDPVVHVLDGGRFEWNDTQFANGTQLLKALKQTDRVRVTLARYFRLGDNASNLAKGLATALAERYPALRCTPYNGCIRVDGPLRGSDIDEALWATQSTALLEPETAHALLES